MHGERQFGGLDGDGFAMAFRACGHGEWMGVL
jgi:hypothetical protein